MMPKQSRAETPAAWCVICGLRMGLGHSCPPLKECRECRQPFRSAQFQGELARRMADESMCFYCLRWTDASAVAHQPESVRISGRHYLIGREDAFEREPRGFSGQRFVIRFNTGLVVETTNLWSQGPIPEHFQGRLTDNAVWEVYPW